MFLSRVFSPLALLAVISFQLGVFNLLPIYPLDGFKLVGCFIPRRFLTLWEDLERYGLLLLAISIVPLMPGQASVVSLILGRLLDIFLSRCYY